MPVPGAAPLPRSTLIYCALPELTQAVVTLPMDLFVPAFYTDHLGLPLGRAYVRPSPPRAGSTSLSTRMLLGVPLLWHFPIDRRRHKALRDEIAERRLP